MFLDPPYEQGLAISVLGVLAQGDWLAGGAMIVVESERSFSAAFPSEFQVLEEREYKDTKITYASYKTP